MTTPLHTLRAAFGAAAPKRTLCALVFALMLAASAAAAPVCGDGILEGDEEVDPPVSPSPVVEVDAATCRYKLEEISQLYCNSACGTWDGFGGCAQGDADVFCKLKLSDSRARARPDGWQVVENQPLPGFCGAPSASCRAPPGRECTDLGRMDNRGVALPLQVHPVLSQYGGRGAAITLADDACERDEAPTCVLGRFGLELALAKTRTSAGHHDIRIVHSPFPLEVSAGELTLSGLVRAQSIRISGGWNGGCSAQVADARGTVIQASELGAHPMEFSLDEVAAFELSNLTLAGFDEAHVLSLPKANDVVLHDVIVDSQPSDSDSGLQISAGGAVALENVIVRAPVRGCALDIVSQPAGSVAITSATLLNDAEGGTPSALCILGAATEGAVHSLSNAILRATHGPDLKLAGASVTAIGNLFLDTALVDGGAIAPESFANIEAVAATTDAFLPRLEAVDSAVVALSSPRDVFGNPRQQGIRADRGAAEAPANEPPRFVEPLPDLTVAFGSEVDVALSGSFLDPEGEVLGFAASALPEGIELADGWLSGTPTTSGSFDIAVTATDPLGASVTDTFTLTVMPNQAPVVTAPLATIAATEGTFLLLPLFGLFEDPEGGEVVLSARELPPGLRLDGTLIVGMPALAGSYRSFLIGTDIHGAATETEVLIIVAPANHPPVSSVDRLDIRSLQGEDVTVELTQYFSDPDGDALVYDLQPPSQHCRIESSALVCQGSLPLGDIVLEVSASDPSDASVTVVVTLTSLAPMIFRGDFE